jgi:hypothetical protein
MFSYYHGAGAMTGAAAGELSTKLAKLMYGQDMPGKELVKNLQEAHPLHIMSVQDHVQSGFFYPFHSFGPVIETDAVVWYNTTPTGPIDTNRRRNITELNLQRALASLLYPNFLEGRPSELWKTHENDIPIMFGFSNYYGEQLVESE